MLPKHNRKTGGRAAVTLTPPNSAGTSQIRLLAANAVWKSKGIQRRTFKLYVKDIE